MIRILLAVLCACLIATNQLTAGNPAARAQEAAELKAAIEASLKETKKSKADDEFKKALAQSKQEFESKGKREEDELRQAIEQSKKSAEAEESAREKKEATSVGERQKRLIIEDLEFLEEGLKGAELFEDMLVMQDAAKTLKNKPYTIATLKEVQAPLVKHQHDKFGPDVEMGETLASAIKTIGYEIDRMNGIPGVSFRDYYKKNKAAVDKQIAGGALDLSNLNLMDLTDFDEKHVPGLTAITFLDLGDNKLKTIPDNIGDFTALQTLGLNNNYLTRVNENIGKLTQLTSLHLHDNNLSDLPGGLAHLPLTHLCINHNKFTFIPAVYEHLAMLTDFDAADNMIAAIPEWIGDLANLGFINLINNRIASLPASMRKLHALTYLGLTDNRIEEVPDWIGDLVNLDELDLNYNKISSLPESITKLINLHGLYLSGNEFTGQLDKENKLVGLEYVNKLPALQYLGLRNNPMPYTDAELRKLLALPDHVEGFLYKVPVQEKVEGKLIDAIKKGDADAVRKTFTTIMAGRILIGPEPASEKIDLSKYRDAKGNNILQIVLQALLDRRKEILADKKLNAKQKVDALHDAEVLYTKIYLTLTQFGGPSVYDMIIARNKAGQDLIQAAVGNLNPDSFFLQTVREERLRPRAEGQSAERFKMMLRYKQDKEEAKEVAKEHEEQKKRVAEAKFVAGQQKKRPESTPTSLD